MEQRRTQRGARAGQRRSTPPRPEGRADRPGKAAAVTSPEDRAAKRNQEPRRRDDSPAPRLQAGTSAKAEAAAGAEADRPRPRPSGATALIRGRWTAAGHGPAALLARLPGSKLTALGNGLLASSVMLLVGFVCSWLLDGSTTPYGVCFLLLSVACALWVRIADALTAPVAVPIAFAFGLLPMGEGEGIGTWFVELATTLAINAGWLYSGTLLAAVIVVVRRGMLAARRRRDRRPVTRQA